MHALPTVEVPQDPAPLGDVTLAPRAMTGRPEADLARLLAERTSAPAERSTAEMLRALRAAYPDSPLAFRVRALAALQRG